MNTRSYFQAFVNTIPKRAKVLRELLLMRDSLAKDDGAILRNKVQLIAMLGDKAERGETIRFHLYRIVKSLAFFEERYAELRNGLDDSTARATDGIASIVGRAIPELRDLDDIFRQERDALIRGEVGSYYSTREHLERDKQERIERLQAEMSGYLSTYTARAQIMMKTFSNMTSEELSLRMGSQDWIILGWTTATIMGLAFVGADFLEKEGAATTGQTWATLVSLVLSPLVLRVLQKRREFTENLQVNLNRLF